MQIDPVPGVSIEPTPIEPKSKPRADQPADAGSTAVAAQVGRPTTSAPPERVTVSVDSSQEVVYRFLDGKTGEVLSQTPAEEVLRVVRAIQELEHDEQRRTTSNVNVRG